MTQENGKVVVAAKFPVLGNLTGTMTMQEVTSGRKSKSGEPAVTTKPWPAAPKAVAN